MCVPRYYLHCLNSIEFLGSFCKLGKLQFFLIICKLYELHANSTFFYLISHIEWNPTYGTSFNVSSTLPPCFRIVRVSIQVVVPTIIPELA